MLFIEYDVTPDGSIELVALINAVEENGADPDGADWMAWRVATFVSCSKLTPPPGTAFLCPPQPLGHRLSQNDYQYNRSEPAAGRFGPPWVAPPYANKLLEQFSIAAIEHEPIAYAEAIGRGLSRYVLPREGEGYTPRILLQTLIAPSDTHEYQPFYALFYPESTGYSGSTRRVRRLTAYESHTRVQGTLLVVLLLAAIAGPFTLPRRMRWAAIVFTLTALFSILMVSS